MSRIRVRVTANTKRSGIIGCENGVVSARVSAPPINGRANSELEITLAHTLGVPVSAVSVVRGHSARIKTVEVVGIDESQIFAIIKQRESRRAVSKIA